MTDIPEFRSGEIAIMRLLTCASREKPAMKPGAPPNFSPEFHSPVGIANRYLAVAQWIRDTDRFHGEVFVP